MPLKRYIPEAVLISAKRTISIGRYIRNYAYSDIRRYFAYSSNSPMSGQRFWLDPSVILNCNDSFDRSWSGRIVDGDWDLELSPVGSLQKVEIAERRVLDNVSWEEAGAYAHMQQLMEDYDAPDGCRTMEDVQYRYAELDQLVAELRQTRRLSTRWQLGGFREFDGIFVHIGRSGDFIFGGGGMHRFGIARALGLTEIPMQLGVVHLFAVESGKYRDLLKKHRKPAQA
ncbi:MAG: hypothetical protein AAF468_04590 [Pseudomonadota bacterium]